MKKQRSTAEGKVNEESAAAQEWYDLSGRKVSSHKMVNGQWSNGKMPRGIYILGGKKILY